MSPLGSVARVSNRFGSWSSGGVLGLPFFKTGTLRWDMGASFFSEKV